MRFLFLLLCSVVVAAAQTNEVVKVKVTGDRVSLRSNPDINSELLDRAMKGEELVFLGKTNGWMAVQAPDSLDFWVSGQYVLNGVEGDLVALRGEFNEWLKIAPPTGSRVWISEDYAEILEPPNPEPVAVLEPAPVLAEPEPEPVVAEPKPIEKELNPLVLVLDKTKEQGTYDEIPGVLRRANPGLYKLVLIVGDLEEPICLVRGEKTQMERYLNRSMLIKGRKFWAKDVDLPVLQPIKIHLDPILTD